jgi:hypothetical protein
MIVTLISVAINVLIDQCYLFVLKSIIILIKKKCVLLGAKKQL